MVGLSRRTMIQMAVTATALAVGPRSRAGDARTLVELAGEKPAPARLSAATLVIIDAQGEYRHGPLALAGMSAAMKQLATLLRRARAAQTPIVHIAHRGDPGDLFDRTAPGGQILPEAQPLAGEILIEKTLPNAFVHTDLQDQLTGIGRKDLIIVGFMTHMCVSSTVRAAYDLDYRITVAADATATRDLPSAPGGGKSVSAVAIQAASLAAMADNFATIVPSSAIS